MRKATWILAGIILFLIISINVAQAAEKLASVDLNAIAGGYNKVKDYTKKLEDKAKGYKAELDKKYNDIKQLQDKINLLSDKEKQAKAGELKAKAQDIINFKQQKQDELDKQDFENSKEIADDVKKTITSYAAKEGYTIVFDDRTLIYQSKEIANITPKVIETLNKGYKK